MKVLIATGSSGGHITPAVGYIEALKEEDPRCQVLLFAPNSEILRRLAPEGIEIVSCQHVRITKSLTKTTLGGLCTFLGVSYLSLKTVARFKPDVVVGFGTIHTVSIILWAWFFRVRTVIHEQNVLPGRANLFLAKFADKICVSFDATKGHFSGNAHRIALTGMPLRHTMKKVAREEALGFFGFRENCCTLLAMGGSQGSRSLNYHFSEAVCALAGACDFQIIHITGSEDHAVIRALYTKMGINARVYPFLKDIQYALSIADLVLCRAGAMTVQELIFFHIPAVLVPYPFAKQHQTANAGLLEKKGCAVIIEQEELSIERLQAIIKEIVCTPGATQRLRACYRDLDTEDAGRALVKETVGIDRLTR